MNPTRHLTRRHLLDAWAGRDSAPLHVPQGVRRAWSELSPTQRRALLNLMEDAPSDEVVTQRLAEFLSRNSERTAARSHHPSAADRLDTVSAALAGPTSTRQRVASEQDARSERDRAAASAQGRTSFAATLAVPCSAHGAGAGEPCWDSPRGACGRRARRAGFAGRTTSLPSGSGMSAPGPDGSNTRGGS